MKIKVNNIRVKLIIAIFMSAGLASIGIILLSIAFIIASQSMWFAIFFNQHILLFIIIFLFIFAILTISFFLLIIKNKLKYLEEITTTLEVISNGNLDISIPVKTSDELGEMARTVNVMAGRLKSSINEERRLERARCELITNISHDLRTPLTSILGYLELIDNIDLENHNANRYIGIANDKCKQLKIHIDYLFEYSKFYSNSISINKKNINLGELIEQVVIGFIPILNEVHMEYRLLFTDEKLIAYVDPILLTRVFDNLINNAILYGKKGKYLDIKLNRDNQYAVISVINYKNKIPDKDLPYVFDRLYKGNEKHSSGLGLSIVKKIIDMHEGLVEVNSNEDRTVFEVRIRVN
ncbi:ATP-binding protein [Wukongibacter sp. M2B1]|uniref:HAMP domain-containing sensor histidine kinase n=1 Tax=Wukongibacter sp. M2B1 TaxID=3088895 RepID=UPI003D797906